MLIFCFWRTNSWPPDRFYLLSGFHLSILWVYSTRRVRLCIWHHLTICLKTQWQKERDLLFAHEHKYINIYVYILEILQSTYNSTSMNVALSRIIRPFSRVPIGPIVMKNITDFIQSVILLSHKFLSMKILFKVHRV